MFARSGRSIILAVPSAIRSGLPSKEWDNIRLPNVRGRDAGDGSGRQAVQRRDQEVRGTRPAEHGLAGHEARRARSFTYRATIPHQGSFRFYVTRDGYSATQPLRWADLDQFLNVPTPPLINGSYEFKVDLPKNRTGRHLIYTVWQNTDTPDTYYSCTDVEIAAKAAPATARAPARTRRRDPETQPPARLRVPSTKPSARRSRAPRGPFLLRRVPNNLLPPQRGSACRPCSPGWADSSCSAGSCCGASEFCERPGPQHGLDHLYDDLRARIPATRRCVPEWLENCWRYWRCSPRHSSRCRSRQRARHRRHRSRCSLSTTAPGTRPTSPSSRRRTRG